MARPSANEIRELNLATNLDAVCTWAGLSVEVQGQVATLFGFPGNTMVGIHPRLLAATPEVVYQDILKDWQVDGAPASLFLKAQAARGCTTAKYSIDQLSAPPPVGPPPAGKAEGRKVKFSALIDSTDDTEAAAATKDQLKEWYANYAALKHGNPLVDKEPSPDQLAAMHHRIVILGLEPYADFSLLTPHGRRMAKVLRHRSWLPQEDGSYKPVEVPGPDSYATWALCFDVYEVILLMLRFPRAEGMEAAPFVVTPIAIEAYYKMFQELCKEFPDCWHLCQKAEDRCRAEHFPRLWRKLEAERATEVSWLSLIHICRCRRAI